MAAAVTNSNSQLPTAVVAALASAVVTGSVCYWFWARLPIVPAGQSQQPQSIQRGTTNEPIDTCGRLPAEAPKTGAVVAQNDHEISFASTNAPPSVTDPIVLEHLARNIAFFGPDYVDRMRQAFVIVVGLGGVGSHAAVMLARSGVHRLRLVDFDQVTLSSLNRHAAATYADVGLPKAVVLRKYIKSVAPFAQVEDCISLINAENVEDILEGKPDYVLDCIDNIDTKVELLRYCVSKNIKVISSMGAGAKGDPSRVQISDISETQEDPLSRSVRRRLKRYRIDGGIPVVYSTEIPRIKLQPLDDELFADIEAYKTLPNFRIRILPVLGVIPAIFGNSMAAYVLHQLAGFSMEPLHIKNRDKLYHNLLNRFQMKEKDMHKEDIRHFDFDANDAVYVIEEIWRGRSALSRSPDRITLARWNRKNPVSIWNVVVMTALEAQKHEKCTDPGVFYPPDTFNRIQERLDAEEEFQRHARRKGWL